MSDIEQSDGYQKLRAVVLADVRSGWSEAERLKKLTFAVERAKHYAQKTGVDAGELLTAWESRRDYWYMNYYQDANMPEIKGDYVRVFATVEDLLTSVGKSGFRCPSCEKVSTDPYKCNAGGGCDWTVYGLLRHMGKGVEVFVKDQLAIDSLFMPVAWESPAEETKTAEHELEAV